MASDLIDPLAPNAGLVDPLQGADNNSDHIDSFVGHLANTISNIPASGLKFAAGIGQAVSHPIDTTMGLLDLAAGTAREGIKGGITLATGNPAIANETINTIDKMGGNEQAAKRATEVANSVGDFYKQRYGSIDSTLKTIEQDPVGTAADISALFGIVGKLAKVSGLAKTAETTSAISNAMNPATMAVKGAKAIIKPAYEYTFGLTTGSGKVAVENALRGGEAFKTAIRGGLSEEEILADSRAALQGMKSARGVAYRSKLVTLKNANQKIDITPIKRMAMRMLVDDYNVKITKKGLDFSRSSLGNNPTAANEVKSVFERIMDWGSQPGDTTPMGLDILKRQIGDSYSSTSQSRAIITAMRNAVKQKIVRAVPQYAQMTAEYEKTSSLITDIEKALSLSDKAATDTAIRKLLTAMREEKGFRREMISELDRISGKDITGEVAGLTLRPAWSNRLGPIAHFYGTSAVAAYLHNPALMALLPFASPRAVGETSMVIGKGGRLLTEASKTPASIAYQAGRLPLQQQE